MSDAPENENEHTPNNAYRELIRAFRASVLDIERMACFVNRAAEIHRARLTGLELALDDAGIIASETAVYLELPRSQNSSPD